MQGASDTHHSGAHPGRGMAETSVGEQQIFKASSSRYFKKTPPRGTCCGQAYLHRVDKCSTLCAQPYPFPVPGQKGPIKNVPFPFLHRRPFFFLKKQKQKQKQKQKKQSTLNRMDDEHRLQRRQPTVFCMRCPLLHNQTLGATVVCGQCLTHPPAGDLYMCPACNAEQHRHPRRSHHAPHPVGPNVRHAL